MKGKRSRAYKVFLKTSLILKRVLNPDKKKRGAQTALPALAGWQIIPWAKQLHRNPLTGLTGSPRASPTPPLAGSRHVLAGSPSAAPAAPRAFGRLLVPREETWPGLAVTGLPSRGCLSPLLREHSLTVGMAAQHCAAALPPEELSEEKAGRLHGAGGLVASGRQEPREAEPRELQASQLQFSPCKDPDLGIFFSRSHFLSKQQAWADCAWPTALLSVMRWQALRTWGRQ